MKLFPTPVERRFEGHFEEAARHRYSSDRIIGLMRFLYGLKRREAEQQPPEKDLPTSMLLIFHDDNKNRTLAYLADEMATKGIYRTN